MKSNNYRLLFRNRKVKDFPSELEADLALHLTLSNKPELNAFEFSIKRIERKHYIYVAIEGTLYRMIESDLDEIKEADPSHPDWSDKLNRLEKCGKKIDKIITFNY